MNLLKLIEDMKQVVDGGKSYTMVNLLDPLESISLFNTDEEIKYRDMLLRQSYKNISWVYLCVYKIATNIARLPIKVYDEKGNDITDSPEFKLLKKPNPYQTRHDFMIESISRLLLQGEMFWYLVRQEGGKRILQIYADWRSEEVDIVPDDEGFIKGFIRLVSGVRYYIPAEDVFFVKFFNPYNPHRGMSPVEVSRHVNELELNAVLYNKKFFQDGMKDAGVFTTDKTLDIKEAQRLKKELKERYSGLENMWEPTILWGGLKFQSLNSMSLRDAEFSTLRKMNREEIAALFQVPLEVMGVGKSTYENYKEARKAFWEETLIPLSDKIISLLNEFFLPQLTQRKVTAEFDFSGIQALKESQDVLLKRFNDGFQRGAVTPNDIRTEVFGLDPVDSPEMNSTYLPANLVPVATVQAKKGIKQARSYLQQILEDRQDDI